MFQMFHLSLLALTFGYAIALQSVVKQDAHLHHLHHDTPVPQAENLTDRQTDSVPASVGTHTAKEISTNNRTSRMAFSKDLSRDLEEIINVRRATVPDEEKKERSASTTIIQKSRGPGCCN